jgi:glutamate dehydrogenase/leucine dehydrogenase
MAEIFRTTRFVTCIPQEVGGSGNPSSWTARGVVCAMDAALAHAGMGKLAGKRVAMQGTGNVGTFMIGELIARGVSKVIATEISEEQAARLRQRFADAPVEVRVVDRADLSIFREPCDVFAPNALGGVLDLDTIPMLDTPVVCGAANNQLLDDRRDAEALAARGITFVPDFVANRMGIVNCANEQYGRLADDPLIVRHFDPSWSESVFAVTCRVLARAKTEGITSTQAANRLADELCAVPHPIFGHRSRDIIDALTNDGWHDR